MTIVFCFDNVQEAAEYLMHYFYDHVGTIAERYPDLDCPELRRVAARQAIRVLSADLKLSREAA